MFDYLSTFFNNDSETKDPSKQRGMKVKKRTLFCMSHILTFFSFMQVYVNVYDMVTMKDV